MWARVIEIMLGFWLVISPFIFHHPADQKTLWINDLSCGFATVALALFSLWYPLRYAHLALIGVALWLIGFGYLTSPYPSPPALQNNILVGLLLLMLAIVPNEASLPPQSWRDFSSEEKSSKDRISGGA